MTSDNQDKTLFPTSLWWWGVLILILIGAVIIRFTGYDFSLPFTAHPNEPAQVIAGGQVLSDGSAKRIGMHGYPPGIITLNYFVLRWFYPPDTLPVSIMGPLRIISIIVSLGSLILVALIGYRIGPPGTGLLAAFLTAANSGLNFYVRFATPDNYVVFFMLLAFFTGIAGIHLRNKNVTLWSTFVIIIAICFKYQAIFLAPLIIGLPLWYLFDKDKPVERREVIRQIAVNTVIFAAFLFWLLMIYPALEVGESPGTLQGDPSRLQFLKLGDIIHNIREILALARFPALPGLLGLAAFYRKGFRDRVMPAGFILLVASLIIWPLGMSFFGRPIDVNYQSLAILTLYVILLGLGYVGLAHLLNLALLQIKKLQPNVTLPVSLAAVALLVAGINLSHLQTSIADAQAYARHDRRNDLREWADMSLEPAPVVLDYDNQGIFSAKWGNYQGHNHFELFDYGDLNTLKPIEEWRADGVVYATLNWWHYQDMLATEEGQAYLAEMTLLKSYPPSDEFRGPAMLAYRIYPIQYELDAALGPITLIGYDLDSPEVVAGDSVQLRYYWQANALADAAYNVYTHLTPPDSRDIVAQADGTPLFDARRSTVLWDDPDEVLVSQTFTVHIPAETAPGEYRLLMGFYQPDAGVRLLSPDDLDFIEVTTLTVVAGDS